jgi:uncharacterized RDD family membrane protein YckC
MRDAKNRFQWFTIGLSAAAILHGLYNSLSTTGYGFLVALFSVAALFFVYRGISSFESDEFSSQEVQSEYASFGPRAGARWIDLGVFGLLLSLVDGIIGYFLNKILINLDVSLSVAKLLSFIMSASCFLGCYFIVFIFPQLRWRKTLGKRLMGLTLKTSGDDLTFKRLAIREIVYSIQTWFLGIGFLTMRSDSKRRALHDILSGTEVVKTAFSNAAAISSSDTITVEKDNIGLAS